MLAHRLSFSRNQGTAVTLPPLMYGEAITTFALVSTIASAKSADVLGTVAQIGVEDDGVVAAGVGERVPERLAEVEVGVVVERPDAVVFGGVLIQDLTGADPDCHH